MESISLKTETKICQICDENLSKYLCPRCGVPYCSLPCYKNEAKHLQCSESFYRDCVVEHVRTEEVQNPENSKKMKETLQRFHEEYNIRDQGVHEDEEEEELDSDDDEPLDKRLQGVDLNDSEEVWKHLSEDEKKEFQSLMKNFEGAGEIIPEWIPWWYDEPEKKLITEVTDDPNTANVNESWLKFNKRQPEILNEIPKLSDLTKIKPSEHVAKGLVNVIAAYVWTARLYNGDLLDIEKRVEIASSIICLSSYLNNNGLFKNIEHAIADVPMNACKVTALSEGGTAIQTKLNHDIFVIISGPDKVHFSVAKGYILSALTECYTVFLKAVKLEKSQNRASPPKSSGLANEFSKLFPSPPPVVSADIKLLNNSKRKLLYLLAFANEYYVDYFKDFGTTPI